MSDFASMGHTAMVRLLVRCAEKDLCLRDIPAQSAESKFNCEEISHSPKWGGEFSKINGLLPSKNVSVQANRGALHTRQVGERQHNLTKWLQGVARGFLCLQRPSTELDGKFGPKSTDNILY